MVVSSSVHLLDELALLHQPFVTVRIVVYLEEVLSSCFQFLNMTKAGDGDE